VLSSPVAWAVGRECLELAEIASAGRLRDGTAGQRLLRMSWSTLSMVVVVVVVPLLVLLVAVSYVGTREEEVFVKS